MDPRASGIKIPLLLHQDHFLKVKGVTPLETWGTRAPFVLGDLTFSWCMGRCDYPSHVRRDLEVKGMPSRMCVPAGVTDTLGNMCICVPMTIQQEQQEVLSSIPSNHMVAHNHPE